MCFGGRVPILPLGIEQEAELLVYAVCAGTLVNNSTVSQSGRREAPSVLWQDHKPLVMGAASGATAKQRTHSLEVGEAVGHHAVAQVTRGLVPGHFPWVSFPALLPSLRLVAWVGSPREGTQPLTVLEPSCGGKCLPQAAVVRNVCARAFCERPASHLGTVLEFVIPKTPVSPQT